MTSIFQEAHNKAAAAANEAAVAYCDKHFGGQDQGACGFAWVNCYNDGRSAISKEVKKVITEFRSGGFKKPYGGKGLDLWNPSNWHGQNIDTKEHGAEVYAKVFKEEAAKLGYTVMMYADSRMD